MSSIPLKLWINHFFAHDVQRLQRAIDRCVDKGQDALPVYIHSPGGSIISMLAMVDLIKASPIPVATVAVGGAMSAGAELLAAGRKGLRFVAPNATVMVHQGLYATPPMKSSDAESYNEFQAGLEQRCFDLLDSHCGKRKGYWKKLIASRGNTDIFLTAEECVEHGLADHVGTGHFYIKPEQTAVLMPDAVKKKARG